MTRYVAVRICTSECMQPQGSIASADGECFIPDEELLHVVDEALRNTGYPALRNIEIKASGGTLVLCGLVPSYFQKQLAQSLAQNVKGVRVVANRLEVVCCR